MTAIRLPALVKATLVANLFGDDRSPGTFKFYAFGDDPADAPPAGLNFRCPCGCDGIWGVAFRAHHTRPAGVVWTWDGNRDAPTCSPSIQSYQPLGEGKTDPHWHGFLTAGFWTQA